jgi:26S proteasome regulatory subunit N13
MSTWVALVDCSSSLDARLITSCSPRQSHTRSRPSLNRAMSTYTPRMVRYRIVGAADCGGLTTDSRCIDLIHFCWRQRSSPIDEPELDLVMVPTDGHFVPHESHKQTNSAAKTNGRVFVLKFMSSSQRHMFWMQSKPQGRNGDPAWFSPRDLKIGQIVDGLLQGEDVDVQAELNSVVTSNNDDRHDDDDDDAMEDVQGGSSNDPRGGAGAGGAGSDATGGDVREEGEGAREGGSDGARA